MAVTIVEFLNARLDEAERHIHGRRALVHAMACDGFPNEATDSGFAEAGNGVENCSCGGPQYALADIAAKRAIVAAHQRHEERTAFALAQDMSPAHPDQRRGATWEVLCLLASVYSDHPDYQQEWKL